MHSHSSTGRSATRFGPCAIEKNRPSRGGRIKWLVNSALALVLLCGVYPAPAHNLQTKMVHMFFDPDTRAMLDERIAGNDPCFPSYTPPDALLRSPQTCEDGVTAYPGDELGIIIKVIPRDGTQTGVGGHIDFYVPNGLEVIEVAYVLPGSDPSDGLSGYDKVPMKGQSLIAVGDGPVGGKATAELIGLTSTNCPAGDLGGLACTYTNVNTVTQDPVVNASGLHRGTIAGVYGDTGIFYATDPDLSYGSWQRYNGDPDETCGTVGVNLDIAPGSKTITNNSGDVFVPCNKWDADQMFAWGTKGTTCTRAECSGIGAPIVDYGDGRGNAPWGFAAGTAGPQSGYAWEFDFDEWAASGKNDVAMRAAMGSDEVGPWKRLKYPGSRVSFDNPGLVDTTLGIASIDAGNLGWDLDPSADGPLPIGTDQLADDGSPKAIRWAVGQLTDLVPEYAWVKVRVEDVAAVVNEDGCPVFNGDTFGGDAGGDNNGKDHLWRYYEPTRASWNACVALGKPTDLAAVQVGGQLQYFVKIYNAGDSDLTNVVIKDVLPGGANFVSAVPAQDTGPNPLVWTLPLLARGDSFEAVVTVTAAGSGPLDNTICVTSDQVEEQCSTETVPSGIGPILNQFKTASTASVAPGGQVDYTITVENIGGGPTGSPVFIQELLESALSFNSLLSVTINGASYTTATVVSPGVEGPEFSVPGFIPAGGTLTLTFRADVDPEAEPGEYCNSFTTWQNGVPLTTGSLACITVGAGKIGDTIFRDWDGDGIQDPEDEGLPGVTVQLWGPGPDGDINTAGDNVLLDTDTTDANGNYLFNGLDVGDYQVKVVGATIPSGYTHTSDPDVNPPANTVPGTCASCDGTYNVTLGYVGGTGEVEEVFTADFGYQPGGSGVIGDTAFKDTDLDGIQDGGEAGIAGLDVILYEDTNGNGVIDAGDYQVATTTTDGSGNYSFTGLAEGLDYLVYMDLTNGDLNDTDLDAAFPKTGGGFYPWESTTGTTTSCLSGDTLCSIEPVSNLSGTYSDADFGFKPVVPGSISGTAFQDEDASGDFTAGDALLPNVTVELYLDGVLYDTQVTDGSGDYSFTNLPPGNYTVDIVETDPDVPDGYSPSVATYSVTLGEAEDVIDRDFPFVQLLSKSVENLDQATPNDGSTGSPGNTLEYSINAGYTGSELLTNAIVTDTVPDGTTFVSANLGGTLGTFTPTPKVDGVDPGVGSITYVASSTDFVRGGTTLNPAKPTGTAEDDVMIAALSLNGGTAVSDLDLTIPAGWTRIRRTDNGGDIGLDVYYKVAGASEPADYTFTYTSNIKWSVGISTYRNVDTTTPVDAENAQTNASSTSAVAPSITTTVENTMLLAIYASKAGAVSGETIATPPSGMTENYDVNCQDGGGNECGLGESIATFVGPGATGTRTATLTVAALNVGQLVALKPAVTTPATTNSLTATPTTVSTGNDISLSMQLDSDEAITGVTASVSPVTVSGTATASCSLTSASPQNISAGGSATFTWDCTTSGTGEIKFTGDASGTWNATTYDFVQSTSNSAEVVVGNGTITWNLGSNTAGVDGSVPSQAGGPGHNYEDDFAGTSFTLDVTGGPSDTSENNSSGTTDWSGQNWWAQVLENGGDTKVNFAGSLEIKSKDGTAGDFAWASRVVQLSGQSSAIVQIGLTENTKLAGGSVLFQARLSSGDSWTTIHTFGNGEAATTFNSNSYDLASELGGPLTDTTEIRFYVSTNGSGENKIKLGLVTIDGTLPPTVGTATSLVTSRTLVGDAVVITVTMTLATTSAGTITGVTADTSLTVNGTNGFDTTTPGTCGNRTPASADDTISNTSDPVIYTYTCTSDTDSVTALPASMTFTGGATGTGAVFADGTSNSVLAAPTLTFRVTIDSPATVGVVDNQAFLQDDSIIPPSESNFVHTYLGATIGDTIWRDWDGDGVQDPDEEGIAGVTLELQDGVCTPGSDCPTTITDSDGNYFFGQLSAGSYTVVVTDTGNVLDQYTQTGDPDALLDEQHAVTLVANEQYLTADFGYQPGNGAGSGSIGDLVWDDKDNDGLYEPLGDDGIAGTFDDEGGIDGVTVTLYEDRNGNGVIDAEDAVIGTPVTTSGGGLYSFTGLTEGLSYIVDVDGDDPDLTTYYGGSYLQSTTEPVSVTNLSGSYLDADFGFTDINSGVIGDQVFIDTDLDGLYDAGEPGLADVTVSLYLDLDGDGVLDQAEIDAGAVAVTSTDETGTYQFTGLTAGTYIVDVDENDPDIPAEYLSSIDEIAVDLAVGEYYDAADFPFVTGLLKSVDKAEINPGQVLTYTLSPYIPGTTPLIQALVGDTTPTRTTYSNSASPAATSEPLVGSAGTVQWLLGTNSTAISGVDGNTTTAVAAGALVTTSGDTVFVTMDVTVTGNGADLTVTPPASLTASPATGVSQVGTVNPIQDTIPAGGGTVSFEYEYTITVSSVTQFTFTGVPSAPGETFTAGTSQGVIVTPPMSYDVTVTAQPDTVDPVTNVAQFQSCGLTVTSQSTECFAVADSDNGSNDLDAMSTINPTTGATTNVGLIFYPDGTTRADHIETAVWSLDGTTLYVTDRDNSKGTGADLFGTLDPATATFTPIGSVTPTFQPLEGVLGNITVADIDGMAFDPISGDLYAVHRREGALSQEDLLLKIDPSTGRHVEDAFGTGVDYVVIDSSTVGLYDVDDIAFDPGCGLLYGTVNITLAADYDDRLVIIDPSDGSVTDIGPLFLDLNANGTYESGVDSQLNDVEGLSFAGDGILYAATADGDSAGSGNPESLWTVNPATGEATLVGSLVPSGTSYADYESLACRGGSADPIDPIDSNEVSTAVQGFIGDTVFIDTDGDGVQDTNEPGLAGVIVELQDGICTTGIDCPTATTDENGFYGFYGQDAGNYTAVLVESSIPGSYLTTTPVEHPVELSSGEYYPDADFGLLPAGTASIGDYVWYDADGQGDQDGTESGLSGITVELYSDVDNDGSIEPSFFVYDGKLDVNGDGVVDADDDGTFIGSVQKTGELSETPNTTFTVVDGVITTADVISLNGHKVSGGLVDMDGLIGITAADDGILHGIDGFALDTQVTDTDGLYLFENLPGGDYLVQVATPPGGATQTYDPDEAGVCSTCDNVADVTLASGQAYTDADFGYNWPLDPDLGTVGDYVWFDTNGDGVQDAGEPPVWGDWDGDGSFEGAYVEIYEDTNGNGVKDPLDQEVASTFTDINGFYEFTNLPPGDYFVNVYEDSFTQAGDRVYVGTTPELREVTVDCATPTPGVCTTTVDQTLAGDEADFGYFEGARIEGTVWHDENRNANLDGTESGVGAGVDVILYGADGVTVVATTTTDAEGNYFFVVPPGDYTVTYDLSDVPTASGDPTLTDPTTPTSISISVEAGQNSGEELPYYNFGVDNTGSIGDRVWNDANNDGDQDTGELGLGGVTLNLYEDTDGSGDHSAGDVYVATEVTDGSGAYLFEGLENGNYIVVVDEDTIPTGYVQTGEGDPGTACGAGCDGETLAAVAGGGAVTNADFGYFNTNSYPVSGVVFKDDGTGGGTADNGIKDGSEPGIPGVTVTLVTTGIYAGEIDVNGDGTVDANDDGTYGGYTVTDGVLVGVTDGTVVNGYTVYGGKLDTDGSGGISASDNAPETVFATTVTDGTGAYTFPGVPDGEYLIKVDEGSLPSGAYFQTGEGGAPGTACTECDSTVQVGVSGASPADQYFGYNEDLGSIAGTVCEGSGDGLCDDPGETPGIQGITVFLIYAGDDGIMGTADDVVTATTTDVNGDYSFTGLEPGLYQVTKINPLDLTSLADADGGNPSSISVDLALGEDLVDQDFELAPLEGAVGDLVWLDTDGDGVYDIGEPGLGNVDVSIYADDGDGVLEPSFVVLDGYIDLDGNGVIDAQDSGTFVGTVNGTPGQTFTIINGQLDLNNDTVATDTGTLNGIAISGGLVNLDGDGTAGETNGDDTGVLAGEDGLPVDRQVTDLNGAYLFIDIAGGDWIVDVHEATLPDGLTNSPGTPADYEVFTLADGASNLDADFGYSLADPTKAMIGDYVWSDDDNDGVQDGGEHAFENVTVTIYYDSDGDGVIEADPNDNGVVDPGEDSPYTAAVDQNGATGTGTTTTEADGSYYFHNLEPDEYIVKVTDGAGTPLEGDTPTTGPQSEGSDTSDPVEVFAGDVITDVDFGYRAFGHWDITDAVWYDADMDGLYDAGETGILGVTVNLVDDQGNVIATTVTDDQGQFEFLGVPDGTYTIEIADNTGELIGLGGTTVPAADGGMEITVAGADMHGENFGYVSGSTIGDTVFSDSDGDRLQDPTELGIAGVEVDLYLDDGDGVFEPGTGDIYVGTQTTDVNGNYLFGGLPNGTYFTSVDPTQATLAGYTATTTDQDPAGVGSIEISATLTPSETTIGVFGGYLDMDGDGKVGGAELAGDDDGSAHGVAVFDGLLDINGDGSITDADDGIFQGIRVVDGWLDFDGDFADNTGGVLDAPSGDADDSGPVSISQPAVLTSDYGFRNNALLDVSGTVWNDLDTDGVREPNAPDNEPGIQSVTLDLYSAFRVVNGLVDVDADGNSGVVLPGDFDADDNGFVNGIEIIQGYLDLNGDGSITDADDGTFQGYTVIDGWINVDNDAFTDTAGRDFSPLDTDDAALLTGDYLVSTTTGSDGSYIFTDLPYGTYNVTVSDNFDTLNGYTLTSGLDSITFDVTEAADADDSGGDNGIVEDIDFGYHADTPTGSIGDFVWLDTSEDYVFDIDETGLAGVTLDLYDTGPDGVVGGGDDVLVASTTTDANGQYLFDELPSGNYFVDVTDTGGVLTGLSPSDINTTDPSAVINLSDGENYQDADFGYSQTAPNTFALGDFVWYDTDGDGMQDEGEIGIAGVDIFVCSSAVVGPCDAGSATYTATTNPDGSWLLPSLPLDNYTVVVDTGDVPGYTATTATSYFVQLDRDWLLADFGFDLASGTEVTIGDTVFEDLDGDGTTDVNEDLNGNGILDAGEDVDGDGHLDSAEGIENVTVNLVDSGGNVVATVTTDANGNYSFSGVPDGTYTVEVTDLNGILPGLNPSVDPDGTLDEATTVVVSGGVVQSVGSCSLPTVCDLEADFGYDSSGVNTSTIGDLVWHDVDGDGVYEPAGDDGIPGTADDEIGIEGVTLDLWLDVDGDGVITAGVDNFLRTVTTDINGQYEFTGLADGDYIVDLTDENGVLDGAAPDGYTDQWTLTAGTDVYPVTVSGADDFTVDFGLHSLQDYSISGTVYNDSNTDGNLDAGEPGAGGATVYLFRKLDNGDLVLVGETTTSDGTVDVDGDGFPDPAGFYQFDNLPDGNYVVAADVTGTIVDGMPAINPADGTLDVTLSGGDSDNNDLGYGITPTAVSVANFDAYVNAGDVVVAWETAFEAGTVGFWLERYDEPLGAYVRVNDELLPSPVFDNGGNVYRLVDAGASQGKLNRYRLVELENTSLEFTYGPWDVKPSGQGKKVENGYEVEPRGRDALTQARFEKAARDNSKGGNNGNKAPKGNHEAIKILVREDGLYTLSAAELADGFGQDDATVSDWIRNGHLLVSHHGERVAALGTPGHDALLFYGEAIDSIYTWDNVYWIRKQGGDTMPVASGGSPVADESPGDFPAMTEAEENFGLVYNPGGVPDEDLWFWDALFLIGYERTGSNFWSLPVPSPAPAPTGEACLTLFAKGFSDDLVDPDHVIWLRVNGVEVGTEGVIADVGDPADPGKGVFDGIGRFEYTACFDQSILADGDNDVFLRGQTTGGVYLNQVLVDRFELNYRRLFQADNDRAWVSSGGAGVVTVDGFGSGDIEVYALGDKLQPMTVSNLTIEQVGHGPDKRYRVSFVPEDEETPYLVQTTDRRLAPFGLVPSEPNHLRDANNRADHLVIAPASMAESAEALADYRDGTGLDSQMVTLEQVYDAFNGGVASPHAITDFLAYAAEHWKQPPLYVALVGKGSMDQKDYLGEGGNLQPILYANTPWGAFACDSCLGDLDGDGISEFAIGRIPVLSAVELDTYVAKLQAYETGDGAFASDLLFAADDPDSAGQFTIDSESLVTLIPAGFDVERAYLGWHSTAHVRGAMLNSFSASAPKGLVNWIGHGDREGLAFEHVLLLSDVAAMNNGDDLPFFAALTCAAGRYELPGKQSLSEALVLHGNGGAVAAFSPTGLSINDEAVKINEGLLGSLYQEGTMRVGDAVLDSQHFYRAQYPAAAPLPWRFMLDIYNLMGDPATVLH